VLSHEVIQRHLVSLSPPRWCAADDRPALDASAVTFAILGGAVALKIGLYFFCVSMRSYSATMLALAEDHLNDIMRSADWLALQLFENAPACQTRSSCPLAGSLHLLRHTNSAPTADGFSCVCSNLVAIFGVAIASQVPKVWYLDPAGTQPPCLHTDHAACHCNVPVGFNMCQSKPGTC